MAYYGILLLPNAKRLQFFVICHKPQQIEKCIDSGG